MPHDDMVAAAEANGTTKTKSWVDDGIYSRPKPSRKVVAACGPYRFMSIGDVASEATLTADESGVERSGNSLAADEVSVVSLAADGSNGRAIRARSMTEGDLDRTEVRTDPAPSLAERIRGSMLGGALGAPVEFMSLAEIRKRFGPKGLTKYESAYGRAGAITDDTQMTMFTADGLIRAYLRAHLPVGP